MPRTQKYVDAVKRAHECREAERAAALQRELKAQFLSRFKDQRVTVSSRSSSPRGMFSQFTGPGANQSMWSADRECVHGRLPSDGSPECGCWSVAA